MTGENQNRLTKGKSCWTNIPFYKKVTCSVDVRSVVDTACLDVFKDFNIDF